MGRTPKIYADVSNNTISIYESDYIRFFKGDKIENMDIKDIDEAVISQFIQRLLSKQPIPYRTLQTMMGYIRGVFNKSVKDGSLRDTKIRVMKWTYLFSNNTVSKLNTNPQKREHFQILKEKHYWIF